MGNEVMILRRGGGNPFAVIGVEYPEGAACTCTGKSGKVLTAKQSPWIFNIPGEDKWTVAISASGKPTREKEVEIKHRNQCEKVKLAFKLALLSKENGLDKDYTINSKAIAVDVTGWDKLRITGKRTMYSASGYGVTVGLASTVGGAIGDKKCIFNADTEVTHEIDVSGIAGVWYLTTESPVFELRGNALYAGRTNTDEYGADCDIYAIELE